MTPGTWVGLILVGAALVDLVIAFFVVGPRLPDKNRRLVQLALVIGAVSILVLGVLYLSGIFGVGGERSA